MINNKNILITGGAGFIGSTISNKLMDDGYKIIILDNLSVGKRENLTKNAYKLYKLDMIKDNIEVVFEKEHITHCIHLAAQTSVSESSKNPFYDAQMNIFSSIKLLELCKKYDIRKFIAASTAAVYGTPQYLPIDENHSVNPISPYGLSKLTMENYIKMSGVPYIIFRFSNTYGEKQNCSQGSGVITIFHNAMLHNDDVKIYGDGNQIRDFISVDDISNICIKMLDSDLKNETFNFSSNQGITINELFNKMKKIYDYKKSPVYLPARKEEIRDSILSNKKIMDKFPNFKYKNFEECIQKLKSSAKGNK